MEHDRFLPICRVNALIDLPNPNGGWLGALHRLLLRLGAPLRGRGISTSELCPTTPHLPKNLKIHRLFMQIVNNITELAPCGPKRITSNQYLCLIGLEYLSRLLLSAAAHQTEELIERTEEEWQKLEQSDKMAFTILLWVAGICLVVGGLIGSTITLLLQHFL